MSSIRKTPNELLFESASPDKVMPIFYLWRAVCRWFYDQDHCPFGFRSDIEKEISKWNKIIEYQDKIRYERFGQHAAKTEGSVINEFRLQIGAMCQWIVYSETGIWNSPFPPPICAATVRIHNLDYRRISDCRKWFPELKINYKKGQANLKQAMEDNPEDYL